MLRVNQLIGFGARRAAASVSWGALVKKASDQTTADYTAGAVIAFDTEVYDRAAVGGWHDNSTNNSRLTVPVGTGKIKIYGQLGIANLTADCLRSLEILKNGSSLSPTIKSDNASAAVDPRMQIYTPVLSVSAGDYFEMKLTIQTDISITVVAAETWFYIEGRG